MPVSTVRLDCGPNQLVYYPHVSYKWDHLWENEMNEAIKEQVQKQIAQQVGEMPTTVEEIFGAIRNKKQSAASAKFESFQLYVSSKGRAWDDDNPITDIWYWKKKLCTLKDLFKPGSNYVRRLSALVDIQIQERDLPTLGDFRGISPDQDFYIADKTLVIYFQLYEITPYVVGLPMFPISVFDLADIIDESGPLGRLATNG